MAKLRHITRFRPVVHDVGAEGARLAGIALVAIGVSGLLAWGMGALGSKGFVAGDPPGVTYTAARCADFFEYEPHATSCEQAATEHHFGEIVMYRSAAGVLGAVVLAVAVRRRRRRPPSDVLPDTLVPTVAATVAGVAGLWLCGQGVDSIVLRTDGGGGEYLSAGIVALALACCLARPVVTAIADRLPPGPAAA
ncbi:MAG TPA: hypothetical protein VIB48_02100 [Acidimicrobiia bacterium]|jgi:hypothetical protein